MLRRAGLAFLLAVVGCASSEAPPLAAAPASSQPASPAETPPRPERAPAPPPEQPEQPADPNDCNPFIAPPERTGGNLTVHAPPQEGPDAATGRMRHHVEGTLSAGAARIWVGPQVPGFVPLTEGTLELFILDHQPDGSFLALYRDPYDASSCKLGDSSNCDYVVSSYARCGDVRWSIRLGDLLSREDALEVQDIRLHEDVLYFNEACQSYSKDAGGTCSSLVAADPREGEVLWRTKPLVSNGRFFVADDYIVAGYGFTAEKDTLSIVRRSDGEVMKTQRLPKAPQDIRLLEPGVIQVVVYPGTALPFRMQGWDGNDPRLVKLK